MKLTKQFTYLEQSHTVEAESTFKGNFIRLDGVTIHSITNAEQSSANGGLGEYAAEIDGDRLTICVFRKEILIFKGDRDIESGLPKHPKKHLHWIWSALSKLCTLPILVMAYLLYSDSRFNIHRVADSTWMTAKLCMVMLGVSTLFCIGTGKISYYQQHPIVPIPQKQKSIALWTFLSILLSTALLLLAHYWILR